MCHRPFSLYVLQRSLFFVLSYFQLLASLVSFHLRQLIPPSVDLPGAQLGAGQLMVSSAVGHLATDLPSAGQLELDRKAAGLANHGLVSAVQVASSMCSGLGQRCRTSHVQQRHLEVGLSK